MSTRCQISALLPDGRSGCIYVHGDGYPEGVGKILADHYTDPDKIAQLIALGDCLSINPSIGRCSPFSAYPDEIWEEIAPAYAETPEAAAEQHRHGDEEFLYVWNGAAWRMERLQ